MVSKKIQDIITRLGSDKAPVLSVLLAVQDQSEHRYLDEDAVNEIARILNVSRCRIYSTATFYQEISLKPRGMHLIRVCCNAPCENANKAAVLNAIEKELRITAGQTTEDGFFTLETVNCLGACYMSPAIKVDDKIYGDLTPQRVIDILSELREEDSNGRSKQ